jgi:SAM-dependent methyltransferase
VVRDSRHDWATYDPKSIPSKADLPELQHFLDPLPAHSRILDLGCGTGRVSRLLAGRGFAVVGVDINEAAVEEARAACGGGARFYVRDVASAAGLALEEPPFDAVVCQLVVSIVGEPDERLRLLRNARDLLAPGGLVYLSASGVSDEINPTYRTLYATDAPETGERYSYFSRDAAGKILYVTHHFVEAELQELLRAGGFEVVSLVKKKETSSRRSDETAFFIYVVGRRSDADSAP